MGGYSKVVSGQLLGKHVPVAKQQILNNATIGLQTMEELCFLRSPCLEVISKGRGQFIFPAVTKRQSTIPFKTEPLSKVSPRPSECGLYQ
jgi:hypothetical protein